MVAPRGYFLDTNIVLLATRPDSRVGLSIDAQFHLLDSPFRPTICEVTVAEMLAFASSWGEKRRQLLSKVIDELLIIPINDRRIHEEWASLHTFARSKGIPIQNDHNDIWIAATARVTGLTLLSTDRKAFAALKSEGRLDVVVIDAKSGIPDA
ncbi:MAG: PIN domain-containing protein [Planctomycetes bacterium]|nr:PIN domain-containing protein [Planctomycetota bacterium]